MKSPRSSASLVIGGSSVLFRLSSGVDGVVEVESVLDPFFLERWDGFFFFFERGFSVGVARVRRMGSLRHSRKVSKLDCSSSGMVSPIAVIVEVAVEVVILARFDIRSVDIMKVENWRCIRRLMW